MYKKQNLYTYRIIIFVPFFAFIINLFLYLTVSDWANAYYDPRTVPNNKIGIHILFPDEISKASQIVNADSKGGWGYVTIPIQGSDRDRNKWQKFFDDCKNYKIIPLIRVATVPEGSNWAKPDSVDLIDFANFLNDLSWPTENRYVIIFNEVNRSDEYGGFVSPEDYADILANSIEIFKSRSDNFFILPAGLDNAASNTKTALNWKTYLQRMYKKQPEIFNKIDGWTSHSYPNPEFSARPDLSGSNKIDSYRYDLRFISQFTKKKLPVFITETGWSAKYLSESQISYYYKYAMEKVWNDAEVVAITPFLLNAQDGPFVQFSFLNKEGGQKEFVNTFNKFAINGEPKFSPINDNLIANNEANNQRDIPLVLGQSVEVTPLDLFINNVKKVIVGIRELF